MPVVRVESLEEDFGEGLDERIGLGFRVLSRGFWIRRWRCQERRVGDDDVGKDLDDDFFESVVTFCEAVEEEVKVACC